MAKSLDIVLGAKSMLELEAKINMATNELIFTSRAVPIKLTKQVFIQKGRSVWIQMSPTQLPPEVEDGTTFAVKMFNKFTNSPLRDTIPLKLKNGKFHLEVTNHFNSRLILKKGETMGHLDLRSAGFIYLSRKGLELQMAPKYFFYARSQENNPHHTRHSRLLDEENPISCEEFMQLLQEIQEEAKENQEEPEKQVRPSDIKKPAKKGQKIPPAEDQRPWAETTLICDPPKEGEIPGKAGKIYKNGYWVDEKDPYPWLDEDDPQRHMTDEEIIRKGVDLSKSQLTDEEKEFTASAVLHGMASMNSSVGSNKSADAPDKMVIPSVAESISKNAVIPPPSPSGRVQEVPYRVAR